MSETLYDILGIAMTATDREIILGYRALAKDCHPDLVDGRRDEIDRITLAKNILLDPDRRKRYDETGEIVPTRADNSHKLVMTALSGAFNFIMAQLVKDGQDPAGGDMVGVMIKALQGQRASAIATIAEADKSLQVLRVPLGRFSEPDGRLEALAAKELAGAEQQVEIMKGSIAGIDQALAYLAGCSYRQGRP